MVGHIQNKIFNLQTDMETVHMVPSRGLLLANVLGYLGAMPAEGLWILLGRIGTGYWFAYFLILAPLVGWLEKPRLIPEAIHLRDKKS